MIYALLDGRDRVSVEHLRAGLAFWHYAAESARYIWGDKLGDPLADKLLAQLRGQGEDGLSREQMRQLLGGRVSAGAITEALLLLRENHLAAVEHQASTGGRRAERWHSTDGRANVGTNTTSPVRLA
jgi:hypothetical protein